MEESGEGAVIYFVTSEIINDLEKETIRGFGKIKTFEYRILRKIREKCKFIFQEQENKIINPKEKINNLLNLTLKETITLLNDYPNSKYYSNKQILLDWINFANKFYFYWYIDGYDYYHIFATFIDKMKKLFFNSNKFMEINEKLIKEVRKEVIN